MRRILESRDGAIALLGVIGGTPLAPGWFHTREPASGYPAGSAFRGADGRPGDPDMTPNHAPRAAPQAPLGARYADIRAASLALAAPLSAEDCQVQSMADASPTKWHLAHVTWFFETFLLERFEAGFVPFDAAFRVLFNSYYQGIGAQHPRPQRGLVSRPGLADVKRYRANVDERMHALLAQRGDDPEIAALVTLGLQHEQQHQELILTDIKHALSFSPFASAYARRWPMAQVRPQPLRWFGYEGGLVEFGHSATLDDFLAFIDDDGYRRPELWLSMGWDWVRNGVRTAPLYWRRDGSRWRIH